MITSERNQVRVAGQCAVVSVSLHHSIVGAAEGIEGDGAVSRWLVHEPVGGAAGDAAMRRLGGISCSVSGIEDLATGVAAHNPDKWSGCLAPSRLRRNDIGAGPIVSLQFRAWR